MHRYKNGLSITVGTLLMAVSYKSIYDAVGMVTGGFSGIGILLRHLAGTPLWITSIILNIPLFIFAYIIIGRNFVKKSIVGTSLLTFFLAVIPSFTIEAGDYLLAAIYGGTICGAGIGLVLRNGASTGGTDLLAIIINHYFKHISVVMLMQILDGLIIISGVMVFGINVSMYAIIAIYITMRVSDIVIEGNHSGKQIMIISDKYQEIALDIMKKLGRGVTALNGKGMYTNSEKAVLLCVVTRRQITMIKEITAQMDSNAFIIVGDVREVMGEGFVQYIH